MLVSVCEYSTPSTFSYPSNADFEITPALSILVSSKMLRVCSRVFRAILGKRFSEGNQLAENLLKLKYAEYAVDTGLEKAIHIKLTEDDSERHALFFPGHPLPTAGNTRPHQDSSSEYRVPETDREEPPNQAAAFQEESARLPSITANSDKIKHLDDDSDRDGHVSLFSLLSRVEIPQTSA
jgi:hypothetical protein